MKRQKRLGSILISVISFFALAAVPHIGTEYASAAPAAGEEERLVGIYINSETFCNAFKRAEDKVFYSDIYNKTDVKKSLTLEEKVTDHTGEVVWTADKSFEINARTRILEAVVPKADNNGLYTLSMTLKESGAVRDSFTGQFVVTEGTRKASDIGACTHLQFSGSTQQLGLFENLGFNVVRDEALWQFVEQKKGVYSIPKRVQNYIDYACGRQYEILMPLTYGNTLYMDPTDNTHTKMPKTDDEIAAYAKYCGFMAKELKGKVKYFEVWNEPNIKEFNYNELPAADYAKVLKAAYNAIKSANSEAVVIGGVCAFTTDSLIRQYYADLNSAGAFDFMDAVSIHPYACAGAKIGEGGNDFKWITGVLKQYNKPIWVTEVGYYSSPTAAGGKPSYSEEEQAAYDARTVVLYRESGGVERLVLYDLQDDGANKTLPGDNFGKITVDFRAKPDFAAVAAAVHFVGNSKIKETKDNDSYSLFEFENTKNTAEKVYVLWTKENKNIDVNINSGSAFSAGMSGNTLSITVDGSGKSVYYADCYGKETSIKDGYSFKADYKPSYIVCR